jgi:hypothetical protein
MNEHATKYAQSMESRQHTYIDLRPELFCNDTHTHYNTTQGLWAM